MVRTLGVQQVTNGKTGLLIRSKKISSAKNQKRLNHIEGITNWEKTREKKLDESTYLEEGVEEEVVTEEVAMDDLRTYVFQPPPEHNSLPKVNIRSSWNTINIDLKSLESH
ncbi:putative zinc finger protein 56-like 2 [Homarus americanus]|uniref:Putative zinc finger protein 56-like 2 n=1 Tax=Homarus americanus TaxID=6706 RepID=A0A8J5TJX8_HOMAM|nr:putative zinc finger protein 56-like 2 [Homarus americanus]